MQVEVDKITCAPILVGVASSVLEIKLAFIFGQISLSDHGLVHDSEKIESIRIGSKNSCK